MKKKRNIIIGVAVLVVLVGLLLWGRFTGSTTHWQGTDVACLPGGHVSAAIHIHPQLEMRVDGRPEHIPGNIGINATCMAEVHTHDASGVLHVESAEHGKTFVLEDFFTVWNTPLERPGHTLAATVNGESVGNPAAIELADGQRIVLIYTSDTEVSSATSTPSETTTSSATTTP